jgi:hypothetical protein
MATAAPSPYQPGSKLEIKNHTPPQPYGAYYKTRTQSELLFECWWTTMGSIELTT